MHDGGLIGIAFPLVALVAPLLVGLAGLVAARRRPAPAAGAAGWSWSLTVNSALLYALAYNLVFFIQELFLVLPKALTPGLQPTLFHNNHNWRGEHPLESLFQGTGAAAILVVGLGCALLVAARRGRSLPAQLFLIWMAFHGLMQALPQFPGGVMAPDTDVGMAMDYLRLGDGAKTALGLAGLLAIPVAAWWLTPRLLALAPQEQVASPGRRMAFIFRVASVPALLGVLLILPFRVPGEIERVVIGPVAVAVIGTAWIQASAWRARPARPAPSTGPAWSPAPWLALLALLIVFQTVLRPGIPF